MPSSSSPQYVHEVQPSDVLFGRGSGPNDHQGNIRFRQYVAERKTAYTATNHRMTKTKIAQEILDLVFADKGRFLKKVEDVEVLARFGLSEGHDFYEVVEDGAVMEKAKQALRQNASKAKDELPKQSESNDPQPVTSLQAQTSGGYNAGLPCVRNPSYESLDPYPYRTNSYGEQIPTIPSMQQQLDNNFVVQQLQQQAMALQQQRVASGSLYMSSMESMPPPAVQTSSDYSIPEVPLPSSFRPNPSASGNRRGSTRMSLTMDQVFNKTSKAIVDDSIDGLTDSFKEVSMTGNRSGETMGTIEAIDGFADVSMSSAFNSSVFSFTPTTGPSPDDTSSGSKPTVANRSRSSGSARDSISIKSFAMDERRKSSSISMDNLPPGMAHLGHASLEVLKEAVFDNSADAADMNLISQAQREAASSLGMQNPLMPEPKPYEQIVDGSGGVDSGLGDSSLAMLESALGEDRVNSQDSGKSTLSYKDQRRQAYLRQDPN